MHSPVGNVQGKVSVLYFALINVSKHHQTKTFKREETFARI